MANLFNKFLGISNSYKYYKSNYELLKKQLNVSKAEKKELQNTINSMSIDLNSLQKAQNGLQNDIYALGVQNTLSSIKQDFKESKVINICFIVNFRLAVIDSLIHLLESDSSFNPNIVVIPYDTYGQNIFDKGLNKRQLKEYEENYNHFKERGFNVIKGYDNELKTLIDIESELNPDILFYSTQWEEAFPEQFRIKNLPKDILLCFIPYGIDAAQADLQFNFELHKKAWKIFYPTQIHKKLAAKYSDVGSSNVVVTGYPKMDPLINGSHNKKPYSWKDSSHKKKRVIWAPHHSVNCYIQFSTFDKNYKFFYNLAKTNSEIEWVFKPHPNLYYYLISYVDGDNFSEEKVEEYYKSWNNLPNATLYEGGDYLNLFATSDAMITDCVSFLSEYLYSGKPGLLLTNETQQFNDYGEIIKKAWYQIDGADFKQIENFINKVVIQEEDSLKNIRENIYNRYLNTNGITASEKIYNYIKSSFK